MNYINKHMVKTLAHATHVGIYTHYAQHTSNLKRTTTASVHCKWHSCTSLTSPLTFQHLRLVRIC